MDRYLHPEDALTVPGRRRIEEKNLNLAQQTARDMKNFVVLAVKVELLRKFRVYRNGNMSIDFQPSKAMLFVTDCDCNFDYLNGSCVCIPKPLSEEQYAAVANDYRITPADIAKVYQTLLDKSKDELFV